MRATFAVLLAATLGLGGCVATPPTPTSSGPPVPVGPVPDRVTPDTAAANFRSAVGRVEPVAEQLCRRRTTGMNCDFLIRIDPNRNAPPNAFQSLGPGGRPVLTFTQALIADTRNGDEIAFVVGHEAAHHIEGHIARQRQSAATGAILGGLVGTIAGGDASVVDGLSRAGATVGARRFSKEHELEADALGTVITQAAGYDPVRGAAYFTRIPDPGDRFLGTHPPNADRIATVRRVAAGGAF